MYMYVSESQPICTRACIPRHVRACISLYVILYVSVNLFVCLYMLLVCPSIPVHVCLSVCLCMNMHVCLSVCMYGSFRPSVHSSIHPSKIDN